MKVLLVEDSRPVRSLFRSVVAQFGTSTVAESHDSAGALRAIREEAPDLIILDRDLPRIDAPAFIAACRAGGADTRILVVSRDLDDSLVEAALDAGACAVLQKPFTPDVLSQRIEESVRPSSASFA